MRFTPVASLLLSFAVFGARPEFGNFLLYLLLNTSLERGAVAQLEQDLEPDEQRGEEDGLDKVVQQSRRSTFKGSVPDELSNPCYNMESECDLKRRGRVLGLEVVGVGGACQTKGGQGKAGDRFKEQI